jgi:hypothetical protein
MSSNNIISPIINKNNLKLFSGITNKSSPEAQKLSSSRRSINNTTQSVFQTTTSTQNNKSASIKKK